jgi:hypothetical protein
VGAPVLRPEPEKLKAWSARRALHLTSESAASTQTCDNGCADRSRERLAHYVPPLVGRPDGVGRKEGAQFD